MSRVGKRPITVPSGVTVTIGDQHIEVKGPKGTLSQQIGSGISLTMEDGLLQVSRPSEEKRHKAMHGLYRALIANMITGVTAGYKVVLELVGVGFKAANQGNVLDLSLGYSHSIMFEVPKELSVATVTEKGKNPTIILEGIDKQLIGHVAAELRSLRKVEPYKGKGVRFQGEVVRRKAGKTAGK